MRKSPVSAVQAVIVYPTGGKGPCTVYAWIPPSVAKQIDGTFLCGTWPKVGQSCNLHILNDSRVRGVYITRDLHDPKDGEADTRPYSMEEAKALALQLRRQVGEVFGIRTMIQPQASKLVDLQVKGFRMPPPPNRLKSMDSVRFKPGHLLN